MASCWALDFAFVVFILSNISLQSIYINHFLERNSTEKQKYHFFIYFYFNSMVPSADHFIYLFIYLFIVAQVNYIGWIHNQKKMNLARYISLHLGVWPSWLIITPLEVKSLPNGPMVGMIYYDQIEPPCPRVPLY